MVDGTGDGGWVGLVDGGWVGVVVLGEIIEWWCWVVLGGWVSGCVEWVGAHFIRTYVT